jgi:putative membrane protein
MNMRSRFPFGQVASMTGAIAMVIGMAAGLHAVAGDDVAQDPAPASGMAPRLAADNTATAALSADDRNFIETALKGGIAEIQEVQLAQQKADSPDLRRAAAQLEQEHKALNAELTRIGSTYGLVLPAEPSDDRQALYQKLQRLSGSEFDREFLKAGSAAHQRTIALFERTGANSSNGEIKKLAGNTLPTLQKHLSMLHGLQEHGQPPAAKPQAN